ncbi:MAG: hypothetical protein QOG20_2173 [Pseudonocardiales bacterium]|nr:hypothetical protein [Pseudonocardiales bacterium]
MCFRPGCEPRHEPPSRGPTDAAGCDKVSFRISTDVVDLVRHHAIRQAVFVREQKLFAHSDHDVFDGAASTVHILAFFRGLPIGTVRLYPMDEFECHGAWCCDRLAVVPEHRNKRLVTPLMRFAVATVAEHGGSRIVSGVPLDKYSTFRRLGWTQQSSSGLHLGTRDVLMETDLTVTSSEPVVAAVLSHDRCDCDCG